MSVRPSPKSLIHYDLEVIEAEAAPQTSFNVCRIGEHIRFNTDALLTYSFSNWKPVVFDLLLVAAAIEYCDRARLRSKIHWPRSFQVRIPVHDPDRWNQTEVMSQLSATLKLLTGDNWSFAFVSRQRAFPSPRQESLDLQPSGSCVIPYSNGLDSRSVAAIVANKEGDDALVRVRVGDTGGDVTDKRAFAAIPFAVSAKQESSFRSRGFKFAAISALAAELSEIDRVIVPESGQGALGPAMLQLRSIPPDFRNHPRFFRKMEGFIAALFERHIRFEQPRLWSTKGQTVRKALEQGAAEQDLVETKSCWRQRGDVNFEGRRHQCGICAACMLRRVSLDHAKLQETQHTYAWRDLSVSFDAATPVALRSKNLDSMAQHGRAGVWHMEAFANLNGVNDDSSNFASHALQLGRATGTGLSETENKLARLVSQHSSEWKAFLGSLGSASFVKLWAGGAPS